jgi:hypothetical protein
MISLGNGNNVSMSDTFDEAGVHYETLAQLALSGAWIRMSGGGY